MKQALTKKLGPMPRWAWLAIAVVVVGYLYYRSRQNAANSSQSSTDPYSSYNTQGYVDQGLPYGDTASAGGYPLSLGGGGFDPTSFYQGLQYGAVTAAGLGSTTNPVAGTTNTPATDNSMPTTTDSTGQQDSTTLTPATGDVAAAVTSQGTTGSTAGSRAVSTKKTPTKKSTTKPTGSTSHLAGAPHTSTGGGQPTRSTTTHTNTPSGGVHPTGSTSALAGGGIATNPGRTVVTPHPAAPTVHHPPQKPKPKPKPTGSTSRRAATR